MKLLSTLLALTVGLSIGPAQTPVPRRDAYESWRLAANAPAATDPARIQRPDGFEVELLRSAQPGEDSWVALAFDDAGRVTIAMEQKGLLRLTLDGSSVVNVEVIDEDLEECRGLLYHGGTLYAHANDSKGFYRLRDTDGDDAFDEKTLLFETGGGVGHGRNQLRLGPDGRIWLVCGDSVMLPEKLSPRSPFRNYAVDELASTAIAKAEDKRFRNQHREPYGYVLAFDPDGTGDIKDDLTLVAGGLRNQLDIDFNRHGDAFVFDADMEWDAGLPWYRPTRVLHIVSGGEYGWRRSPGTFPVGYEDSLPSACDVGLSSPTGVGFAYDSHFPRKWREAFLIADWAYGRILAIHLEEAGASYTGTMETFLSGRPLNVTDFVFGRDGAMYFTTGGRKTRSGLYRVSYQGKVGRAVPSEPYRKPPGAEDPPPPTTTEDPAALRALRRDLEALHPPNTPGAVETAWPLLEHPDRHVRFAARVAIENQPPEHWQLRALRSDSLTAWLAVARVGHRFNQEALLDNLNALDLANLPAADLLRALRVYQLAFIRMGDPGPAVRDACAGRLLPLYPHVSRHANHELAGLLFHLAPAEPLLLEHTLDLLGAAEATEDLVQYLYLLRGADHLALDDRRRALDALRKAEAYPGGRTYVDAVKAIRASLAEGLDAEETFALAPLLAPPAALAPAPPAPPAPGRVVRHWTMEDLLPALASSNPATRKPARGKQAFLEAGCALCHRAGAALAAEESKAPAGGVLGPDLAGIANRFSRADILAAIIHPSDVIADKYRIPEAPNVSAMPPGLLDVLTKDEVLDLLAFLESVAPAAPSNP